MLAPRGPLRLFPRRNPAHPSWRVARGERSGPSFERWRTSLRDSYAYGVELNDAQLGDIVKSLVQADRHRDLRMGVVGSHGAPLGEDGWLAWAGPPTEGAARVPLLWIDTTSQDDPLRAPWVSSADLASLLEGGRLPDPPTTPRAWTLGAEGASPAPSDDAPGITWWGEVGAVRWREGEPVPPRWAGDVEAWRDARSRMADAPVDDALAEALRALGYGEP